MNSLLCCFAVVEKSLPLRCQDDVNMTLFWMSKDMKITGTHWYTALLKDLLGHACGLHFGSTEPLFHEIYVSRKQRSKLIG